MNERLLGVWHGGSLIVGASLDFPNGGLPGTVNGERVSWQCWTLRAGHLRVT
jgi:hypothetical protein